MSFLGVCKGGILNGILFSMHNNIKHILPSNHNYLILDGVSRYIKNISIFSFYPCMFCKI